MKLSLIKKLANVKSAAAFDAVIKEYSNDDFSFSIALAELGANFSDVDYEGAIKSCLRFNKVKVLKELVDEVGEDIEQNTAVDVFKMAIANKDAGLLEVILKNALEKIPSKLIVEALESAAVNKNGEFLQAIGEIAREKIPAEIFTEIFKNAALYDHADNLLKIAAMASDEISDEAISDAFKDAARYKKIEILQRIGEIFSNRIANEDIAAAFKNAALYDRSEVLGAIWSFASDKLSDETISSAFAWAAGKGNIKALWTVESLGGEKALYYVADALSLAATFNHVEIVSKILAIAGDKLTAADLEKSLKDAIEQGSTGVIQALWHAASDTLSLDVLNSMAKFAADQCTDELLHQEVPAFSDMSVAHIAATNTIVHCHKTEELVKYLVDEMNAATASSD